MNLKKPEKKIINVKNPFFIIAGLFLIFFYAVSQLSNTGLSDEPVVITKQNPPTIVMFGNQSCHYCAIARSFFKKHNLPYTDHDIERSTKHREMFYRLGGQGTPLIIVNKTIIHGFDEKRIREAL